MNTDRARQVMKHHKATWSTPCSPQTSCWLIVEWIFRKRRGWRRLSQPASSSWLCHLASSWTWACSVSFTLSTSEKLDALAMVLSTWHKLQLFGSTNLNWEIASLRLPVGEYVGYFLDQARPTVCMCQGCNSWTSGSELCRKASWANHNEPASKWDSSMTSASVPSSMFLPQVPSVMEYKLTAARQTNLFFPRFLIVVMFYHRNRNFN